MQGLGLPRATTTDSSDGPSTMALRTPSSQGEPLAPPPPMLECGTGEAVGESAGGASLLVQIGPTPCWPSHLGRVTNLSGTQFSHL